MAFSQKYKSKSVKLVVAVATNNTDSWKHACCTNNTHYRWGSSRFKSLRTKWHFNLYLMRVSQKQKSNLFDTNILADKTFIIFVSSFFFSQTVLPNSQTRHDNLEYLSIPTYRTRPPRRFGVTRRLSRVNNI